MNNNFMVREIKNATKINLNIKLKISQVKYGDKYKS